MKWVQNNKTTKLQNYEIRKEKYNYNKIKL